MEQTRRTARTADGPAAGTAPLSPARAPLSERICPIMLASIGAVSSSVDVWLLMNVLFPVLQDLWAPAVTIQAVVAAAGYALVALVASRLPRRLNPFVFGLVSAACIAVGALGWWQGTQSGLAGLATIACCICHFGCSWSRLTVGLSLCGLGNKRDLVVAAVAGELVGASLRLVLPLDMGFGPTLALVTAVELVMLAAGSVGARAFLRSIPRGDAPASLEATNPESFLSPSHRLFVLIAFFEFIHGISLAERTSETLWAANIAVVAIVGVGAAWVITHRTSSCEDTLLYAAALLMLAGFMLRPTSPVEATLSSACSFGGAALSWILIWIVFASVGMGNPAGAAAAIGVGYTMQALGLEAGSVFGKIATGTFGASETFGNIANTVVIIAFIGYLLVTQRGFSFSKAFADIVPVAPLETLTDSEVQITQSCQALAYARNLSERELEVMNLLARGKNGQEIQDELLVSRNTVKTHVRHIYRKLDVHSQQELVDLVGARRHPTGTARPGRTGRDAQS